MDVFRNARQNLMRRQAEADEADIEQQQARGATPETNSRLQMQSRVNESESEQGRTARPSPVSSVLRRLADMPRPSMAFARQSGPRPTSSRYDDGSEMASPKTPQFTSGMGMSVPPPMPPMPSLGRRASRGPASGIAEPSPAVPAYHVSDSRRRRFDGADPAEMHLATMADDGRRRQRGQRRHGSQELGGRYRRRFILGDIGHSRSGSTASGDKKKFLFCFPYIKSRRMRANILRSCVSGSIMALMLTIFLALFMTHNVYNSEFSVLLILILLLTAAFFAHSVIRLVLFIVHPPTPAEEAAAEEMYQRRRRAAAGVAGSGALGNIPSAYGPGGYAIPHEPIRVVLARDEEAAGIESEAVKTMPPAYGLWRESVRVDPNRIYWQRNEEVPPVPDISQASLSSQSSRSTPTMSSSSGSFTSSAPSSSVPSSSVPSSASVRTQSPRPPSYMSEDGVQYVVEAQPRSIAPTTEVPLPHPAEAGRIGRPAEW